MPNYDPLCQACKEKDETTQHMFQCTNPDYVQWRTTFFRRLVSQCNGNKLSEEMTDVLTDGLQAGFDDEELDPAEYSMHLYFLIVSQNNIGWLNLFKGLWSKQCLTAHEEYCKCNEIPKKNLWTIGVTSLCWTMWMQLWKIRNGHHHGVEQDDKSRRTREKLCYQLKDLYDKKPKTLAMDQDIFTDSVETHLDKSTFRIKTWIATNEHEREKK